MSWTQPQCDRCWSAQRPGQSPDPYRLKPDWREDETCAWCGQPTRSGIYVRADPRTVPHPRKH